jgi:hypothetical protein
MTGSATVVHGMAGFTFLHIQTDLVCDKSLHGLEPRLWVIRIVELVDQAVLSACASVLPNRTVPGVDAVPVEIAEEYGLSHGCLP